MAVREMVHGLTRLGVEVSVVTTGSRRASPPAWSAVEEGGRWHVLPRSMPGRWKFSWPLTRWLRQHVAEFHVVHVHALFSYSTIPACRLSADSGIPYVVRPLGTLDPWSLRHKRWKKRPYFRLVERAHLRGAAAIHVTSAAEGEALRRLGFRDTVRIIPLGVRAPVARPSACPGSSASCRLLFLSRIHEKKGLPLVLEALAGLSRDESWSFELVVAGDGEPAYVRRMRRLVAHLGLTECVTFVGFVTGQEKERVLRDADVFVLPSHAENFGLAAAEALAAGIPVVLSDRVGIAQDVQKAGAGLVVPRNVASLREALSKLMRDRDERQTMGRRAAALAHDRFQWERTCGSLLELYSTLQRRHKQI